VVLVDWKVMCMKEERRFTGIQVRAQVRRKHQLKDKVLLKRVVGTEERQLTLARIGREDSREVGMLKAVVRSGGRFGSLR
jgi:hypothetical protein